VVTGQGAELASVQYIIDGKQSMTVLKDVRNLVDDAIEMAISVVEDESVETTGEYDNGVIMVPAKQSEVITVDQSNVQQTIIDSGYWDASEFTGLEGVSEPEAPSELSVGIVLPTKDEPRWIQDQTRFESKLNEAGYEVEILFSQADPSMEKSNVEALITKGVKVIILCPHDSAAAAASAEAARDAGVTIVSYDRLITDTDAVDYYVTFDSVAVGEAQAQYLVDKAEGEGNPLYLYAGAATDNNAFLFFEGAWNVLQPKIADGTFYIVNSSEAEALQDKAELTRDEMGTIIGQITTNWDFNAAKSLADANLTSASSDDKGDVFILAPNDGTARAIADAFGADPEITSYVVTGQDAEIASVQYIIDGKQSMTVLKDVRNLVDDAIEMAISVVEDESVETTGEYDNGVIMVPAKQSEVITVDQSNVQETIIDSGYWDASEFTGLD
jgi:putative multiple sugar transport system substrate-binding protein